MVKKFDFTKDIDALVERITPLLNEINLETHVPVAIDMDDPSGEKRKQQPEYIQKIGALCDLEIITPTEHRRLYHREIMKEENEALRIDLGLENRSSNS